MTPAKSNDSKPEPSRPERRNWVAEVLREYPPPPDVEEDQYKWEDWVCAHMPPDVAAVRAQLGQELQDLYDRESAELEVPEESPPVGKKRQVRRADPKR